MVMDALKAGHCWVAYDLPALTDGFRFLADNDDGTFIMGDTVQIKRGLTLQIRMPQKANCRLIKDGKVIKQWEIGKLLPTSPQNQGSTGLKP